MAYQNFKKNCEVCTKEYMGVYNSKGCSKECKKNMRSSIRPSIYIGISTGSIGALNELLVCADLLKNGFNVFRSVSQACSCDILAMKNDIISRIEVRTGMITIGGNISYRKQNVKADCVAVVVDGKITYIPSLENYGVV